VLLTGATGGIGRAVARELARAGATLMLVGRRPVALATLAATLGEHHHWKVTDLDHAASPEKLAEAAARWGANVLVHAAGVPAFGRLESLAPEQIRQLMATNLLAPMLLTQAMLPHLRSLPRAQVICLGSALGRMGLPGFSVYSASKFGLRGFAEALRRELADTTVRVQYLGPRSTRTAFNDDAVEAYNRATHTAMDPPERVALALRRLLESEAAERFVGFPEALAVRLNGIVPSWLDGAFAAHRAQLPAPPTAAPSRRLPSTTPDTIA
jgi:short-subunit dehydrogenase